MEAVKKLSEKERDALHKICDLLVPESIDIGLKDVLNGYSKKKATEMVMEAAEKNPATTNLKMRIAYKILRECYQK